MTDSAGAPSPRPSPPGEGAEFTRALFEHDFSGSEQLLLFALRTCPWARAASDAQLARRLSLKLDTVAGAITSLVRTQCVALEDSERLVRPVEFWRRTRKRDLEPGVPAVAAPMLEKGLVAMMGEQLGTSNIEHRTSNMERGREFAPVAKPGRGSDEDEGSHGSGGYRSVPARPPPPEIQTAPPAAGGAGSRNVNVNVLDVQRCTSKTLRERIRTFVGDRDYFKFWARSGWEWLFAVPGMEGALSVCEWKVKDGVPVKKSRGSMLFDEVKRSEGYEKAKLEATGK